MRIVGLDLSLSATGVACVETATAEVGLHTVRSAGRRGDDWLTRASRLQELSYRIDVAVGSAELVVVEGPSFNSFSTSMHDRSGLWWAVVAPLLAAGVPLAVAAPATRAKYACGKGNGEKKVVLAAMRRRFPALLIANDNEADALALACMGARWAGEPLEAEAGQAAQVLEEAVAGVQWPVHRPARPRAGLVLVGAGGHEEDARGHQQGQQQAQQWGDDVGGEEHGVVLRML